MHTAVIMMDRLFGWLGLLNFDDANPQWDGWGFHFMPGAMRWDMMGWFGQAIEIVFFVVLIIAVVYIARSLGRLGGGYMKMEDSSLEILKKRYARGEIDKQEYEEKKKDLLG